MGFSLKKAGTSLSNAGKAIAADPMRAVRAGATGGLSEAYKATVTDPANKAKKSAAEAADAANSAAVNTQQGVAGQMADSGSDYMKSIRGETDKYRTDRDVLNNAADKADRTYGDSQAAAEDAFQTKIGGLQKQAEDQSTNARNTYSNSILPSFKNSMEDAQKNAAQAMSLSDAGDMNNSVQQGVRNFYDKQAMGEGKQGLADVGVMQAMGAQALQGQMGQGAPMTGAQLQLATAQNMQQGGQAFANTQRRIQNLKQQGIEQGIAQSGQQYERGQRAREFSQNSIGAYEGGLNRMNQEQAGFRSEIGGQQGQLRGSQYGKAGALYGSAMSQNNRAQGAIGQNYGMNTGIAGQQYGINTQNAMQQGQIGMMQAGMAQDKAYNQALQASAEQNRQNAMWGGGIQAAATGAGAVAGGAQGAQVGSSVGGAGTGAAGMGQQAAPPPPGSQQGFNWQGANQGAQTAGQISAPIGQAMASPGYQPQRPRGYGVGGYG